MQSDDPRLKQLVDLFLIENAKLNLSAFRTVEHCTIGNVQDSLSLLAAIESIKPLSSIKRLLDIGTGGGFPLLPLAIALEDTDCVGIDAIQKKISALWRIVEPMGLRNASMLCGRSEELAHKPGLRATFDVVTARAVAPLPVLLEYAIPFLNVGGIAVFWKSTKVADELASSANAQKVLHAPFVCTYDYELPSGWGKRTLVIFRKTKPTSDDYPRKVGVPKAKPL